MSDNFTLTDGSWRTSETGGGLQVDSDVVYRIESTESFIAFSGGHISNQYARLLRATLYEFPGYKTHFFSFCRNMGHIPV